MLAYLIILYAFQQSDVSFVVATREVSVVFGSILGFIFLKEKITFPKIVGIVSVTTGLVIIKLNT
jgi:uncharacterized membrane protein